MNTRRFVSYAGTATVATIAAYASYEHMRQLALTAGQSHTIAAVLPLSVDGLVVVASIALVDGRERKGSAWFAFLLGVSASIVANILAAGPTLTDRCVSAWPSVALLVTIEVIARGGRKAIHTVDTLADARVSPEQTSLPPSVGDQAADSNRTKISHVGGATDVRKPRAPRSDSNAVRVAKAAARKPSATPVQLAAALGITEATVRRHLQSDKASSSSSVAIGDESVPTSDNGQWTSINGHDLLAADVV